MHQKMRYVSKSCGNKKKMTREHHKLDKALCPCTCAEIVIDLDTGEVVCCRCGLVLNTAWNDLLLD